MADNNLTLKIAGEATKTKKNIWVLVAMAAFLAVAVDSASALTGGGSGIGCGCDPSEGNSEGNSGPDAGSAASDGSDGPEPKALNIRASLVCDAGQQAVIDNRPADIVIAERNLRFGDVNTMQKARQMGFPVDARNIRTGFPSGRMYFSNPAAETGTSYFTLGHGHEENTYNAMMAAFRGQQQQDYSICLLEDDAVFSHIEAERLRGYTLSGSGHFTDPGGNTAAYQDYTRRGGQDTARIVVKFNHYAAGIPIYDAQRGQLLRNPNHGDFARNAIDFPLIGDFLRIFGASNETKVVGPATPGSQR